eukprot:tig00000788_g4068.t1
MAPTPVDVVRRRARPGSATSRGFLVSFAALAALALAAALLPAAAAADAEWGWGSGSWSGSGDTPVRGARVVAMPAREALDACLATGRIRIDCPAAVNLALRNPTLVIPASPTYPPGSTPAASFFKAKYNVSSGLSKDPEADAFTMAVMVSDVRTPS